MDQEVGEKQSTFELANNFYNRKIADLMKEVTESSDFSDLFVITKIEEIESLELKLSQLERRHKVGLIK